MKTNIQQKNDSIITKKKNVQDNSKIEASKRRTYAWMHYGFVKYE